MSETDFEASSSSSMGNMPVADVSTSDSDTALRAIWDKNNGPEAELKNPLMPDVPAGVDTFQATADWIKLPLKERQMTSAVHREFADLKKQGEALGMKTETAADMKAIQDMLAAKDGAQQQRAPQIDRDTQASLETFKAVVPFAKDHREASQFLNGWAETIGRDPDRGWSELLKAQGMGHLLRDTPGSQPSAAVPRDGGGPRDGGVAAWAAKRGVSAEDQRAMGDIVSEPTWREIAGESLQSTLDRAHKALMRSKGRNNSHGRMNRDLEATLREVAADMARP